MPPNLSQTQTVNEIASTSFSEVKLGPEKQKSAGGKPRHHQIVWRNVVLMAYLHIATAFTFVSHPHNGKHQHSVTFVLYIISGLGITAGAHRLWSHKSYKAKLPLRALLALFNTMAFENDIYEWARDHRVHHKFSETNADPHNATRGFFFSHVGWLLVKKHEDVVTKGKSVDCADILADPVVQFQRKFNVPLVLVFCFLVPTYMPYYLWNETLWNGFFVCSILRYCFMLNMTWLVNSAAHMWGDRPYDRNINPSENFAVIFGAIGEGFHNYHHTFPWDYATSEYGIKYNITTMFIDTMAFLGLAYDRKTVSNDVIKQRCERTGDGSHHSHDHHHE